MAEVQRARLPGCERSIWLVVGDDFLPIEPIKRFVDYLDDLERSPNTVRAYAYHLKLFWDYLQAHDLDWREVGLAETERILQWAQDNRATRKLEMNERVRKNLVNMITALESGAGSTDNAER